WYTTRKPFAPPATRGAAPVGAIWSSPDAGEGVPSVRQMRPKTPPGRDHTTSTMPAAPRATRGSETPDTVLSLTVGLHLCAARSQSVWQSDLAAHGLISVQPSAVCGLRKTSKLCPPISSLLW